MKIEDQSVDKTFLRPGVRTSSLQIPGLEKLNERGFTLAGALAIIAILAIFWVLTLPLWARIKQRDNEEELIFRGTEYVEAIARYHQKFGTYPPDIETLEKLKYIRKLYVDPMTKTGKWKVLHPDALAQTGVAGQIIKPGGNSNDNKNSNGLSNQGDSRDDDDDEDEDSEEGELPGLSSSKDEKEEAEEKEVESIGPVVGVVSRSKKTSIRIYNGQDRYNKWKFVYALPQQRQGQPPPGAPQPQGGKNPAKGTTGTQSGTGSMFGPSNTGGSGGTGGSKPPPQPVPDDDDDDDDDER